MKFRTRKYLIYFLLLPILNVQQFSLAAPMTDFPGTIPLEYKRQSASDLEFEGHSLLPDEARALYETGKVSDLSLLNPSTSEIWKDETQPKILDEMKKMGLEESGETFEFVSFNASPQKQFSFIAQKIFANGVSKFYRVYLSSKSHNVLMRQDLLRKLGYRMPPVVRLSKARIKFKGSYVRTEFLFNLNVSNQEPLDKWITTDLKEKDQDSETLDIQDMIVFEGAINTEYEFSQGVMTAEYIKGRRVFNSLLIPFYLTDSPQNLNLMTWTAGQIINNQLYLQYEDAEAFSMSFEDARWITRRILKLNSAAWEYIAKASELPLEEKLLLKNKLISRRNSLLTSLKFQNEFKPLDVDYKISLPPRLVNGKLLAPPPRGYARDTAGEEPKPRWSAAQAIGLLKSKTVSNLIDYGVGEVNRSYLHQKNLGKKIFNHQLDNSVKQFVDFLKTGKASKIPRGFWSTPVYNANLILGRETIAGNYLGTENQVQLADTLGLATEVGRMYMGEGYPDSQFLGGQGKLFWVHTYSHVKPLYSIQMGLDEKYKNMAIPWLRNKSEFPLRKILSVQNEKIPNDEKTQKIQKYLEQFSKIFGVGESMIVTTSIGTDLTFKVGKSLSETLNLYTQLQDRLSNISRSHIYYKNDKNIQLYIDPAIHNIFSWALGLSAQIPIFEIGWRRQDAVIATQFYNYNIDPDLKNNPRFFENINAILGALEGAPTRFFTQDQSPWYIHHRLKDSGIDGRFLFLKAKTGTVQDHIQVTSPKGATTEYFRNSSGERFGRDYESLSIDIANYYLNEHFPDKNIHLSSTNSGDPADSIFGKSVSRLVNSEGRSYFRKLETDNLFASVVYKWRGWKAKHDALIELVRKVNSIASRPLIPEPLLNETTEIQFYTVQFQASLYQAAVKKILGLELTDLQEVFKTFAKSKAVPQGFDFINGDEHVFWINAMNQSLMKMKKTVDQEGQGQAFTEELCNFLDLAENQLQFAGLVKLVGGEKNLFIKASINGFRKGTMNGDSGELPVLGNTIGEIGSQQVQGPLSQLQSILNISGGELLGTWLVNPL